MLRSIFIAIACGSVVAAAAALGAEARTHGAGSSAVPRIVAGALPAARQREAGPDRARPVQATDPHARAGLGLHHLRVTLSDGRSFGGALGGSDRFNNLALLKIEGSGFTAMKLGGRSMEEPGLPILHNLIQKEER